MFQRSEGLHRRTLCRVFTVKCDSINSEILSKGEHARKQQVVEKGVGAASKQLARCACVALALPFASKNEETDLTLLRYENGGPYYLRRRSMYF